MMKNSKQVPLTLPGIREWRGLGQEFYFRRFLSPHRLSWRDVILGFVRNIRSRISRTLLVILVSRLHSTLFPFLRLLLVFVWSFFKIVRRNFLVTVVLLLLLTQGFLGFLH